MGPVPRALTHDRRKIPPASGTALAAGVRELYSLDSWHSGRRPRPPGRHTGCSSAKLLKREGSREQPSFQASFSVRVTFRSHFSCLPKDTQPIKLALTEGRSRLRHGVSTVLFLCARRAAHRTKATQGPDALASRKRSGVERCLGPMLLSPLECCWEPLPRLAHRHSWKCGPPALRRREWKLASLRACLLQVRVQHSALQARRGAVASASGGKSRAEFALRTGMSLARFCVWDPFPRLSSPGPPYTASSCREAGAS